MCVFASKILTFIKAKFACFIDNETRRSASVACAAMGKKKQFFISLFATQNGYGMDKAARQGSPRRNDSQ